MLDRIGVLTTADELALGELCEAFSDLIEARASLASGVEVSGVVIAEPGSITYTARTKEGWMIRPRPEMVMIEAASKRFHGLLGAFGLTPATRSKVQLAEPSATDPDDYFT